MLCRAQHNQPDSCRDGLRAERPVASGMIASLAHPGGNITGVALLAAEGDVKRLEILAEAIPSARRLAVLVPRTMTVEIVRGEADIQVVLADLMALTKLNFNNA